jgi:hypothetical protein
MVQQLLLLHEQVIQKKIYFFKNVLIESSFFLATQFYQADTQSHRYSSIGTYTVNITVQGPYNSIIKTLSVVVQNAVKTFTVNFTNIIGSPSQIFYNGGTNNFI